MPTIHVKEKCTFTDASGRRHDFAVGSHDVADDIATHSYVQAHCSGQPIPVLPADPAGALAALTALTAQVADLTAQVADLTQERDAQISLNGELFDKVATATAERDAARAQVVDLGNQIAELQAGGEAPAAAGGKSKKG